MDEQMNAEHCNECNYYLESQQQPQHPEQQQQKQEQQQQQQMYLLSNTITKLKSEKLLSQKLRWRQVKCNNSWIYVRLQLFWVFLLLLLKLTFMEITTVNGNLLQHTPHYTHLEVYRRNPRRSIKIRTNVKMLPHNEYLATKNVKIFSNLSFDAYKQLPKFNRLTITKKDLEWLVKGFSNARVNHKQQQQQQPKQQQEQQSLARRVEYEEKLSNSQLEEMHRKCDVKENEKELLEMPLNHVTTNSTKISKHNLTITDLLTDYVTNFFTKGHYNVSPELWLELKNFSVMNEESNWPDISINVSNMHTINQTNVGMKNVLTVETPRNLASGRLLFLTGLKKILWPLFMGLQILKSLLIAMFIPAIIGSLGKLFNKGIGSGSAPLFIRPMEGPTDLDFRDNTINFDDDNKFLMNDAINNNNNRDPYSYHQAEASQLHGQYVQNSLDSLGGLTRLGLNERQHQLMQDSYFSALKGLGSASFKQSGSLATSSSSLLSPLSKSRPLSTAANVNTFHSFQKVPDSSLLLSNYDPFYSPLLSRLDSVFAQLKLNSSNENCREKVICLMYSNPTKYAPYSNLVSAQLSRELNELRKPTIDNPDILRFFKYMRAAKDGQDGVDCELTFNECPEFKDFENPAMVTTYNDINKLVEARQML